MTCYKGQIGLRLFALGIVLIAPSWRAQASDETARTLEAVQALNPAVAEYYQPLHDYWAPLMGIHWGVPGPHVTFAVGEDDVVTTFEAIYPPEIGWYPWFDQPEGEPMYLEGVGEVYTQHVWITVPETVQPGEIPDEVALSWSDLAAINPNLAHYEVISPYVPGQGFHYSPPGPGVILTVLPGGDVSSFEMIFPVEQGWFPWFDQAEGEPMVFEGVGEAYTQHIFVVDPATIR